MMSRLEYEVARGTVDLGHDEQPARLTSFDRERDIRLDANT